MFRDNVAAASLSLNLNIPKQSTPILPTLPKGADNQPIQTQLNTLQRALSLNAQNVPDNDTQEKNALEAYVDVMSKINAFNSHEREAVYKVNATLSNLELLTLAEWMDAGEKADDLNKPNLTPEQQSELKNAQNSLAKILGISSYTPDFIASVASSLAQTKKIIGIILEAVRGEKGGNALVDFTSKKNLLAIASNKLEQSLGNLDTETGAYNLAQANMMQQIGMTIQGIQEDIVHTQSEINDTQKIIQGLNWTVIGLSAAALAVGIAIACGAPLQPLAAAIGIALGLALIAFGAAEVQVGRYELHMADDQEQLAKENLSFQQAKTNTQEAQKFTDFMTNSIAATFTSVKQMEAAFQEAMQAAEASIHELRNN